MPLWARLVTAVAACKTTVGIVVYLSGLLEPGPGLASPALYAFVSSAFLLIGSILVLGHKQDCRALWLGGLLLLVADPFTPLIRAVQSPAMAPLSALRTDPFIALFLCRFVEVFPDRAHGALAIWLRWFGRTSAAAAVTLVVVNILPLEGATVSGLTMLRDGRGRPTLYWPVVLGLVVLVLPPLVVRAYRTEGEHKSKMRWFIGGIAACATPFTIQVVLEELSPGYKSFVRQPAIAPWVTTIILGSLVAVPVITFYSVMFDRVVEMRVVLRGALQYALARYTVLIVTLVPFTALAILVYMERHAPVASLFEGPRAMLLATSVACGLAAMRWRHAWLDRIDRRYFRAPYDASVILNQLAGGPNPASVEELGDRLTSIAGQHLHADLELFVLNDARTALRHVRGVLPSLEFNATLVKLSAGASSPMDLPEDDDQSPLARIRDDEKAWVKAGRFRLIVAMRGSGEVVGLMALGEKRSGLPFSQVDRRFLTAAAAAGGLAIENLRLRSTPSPSEEPAGLECVECARVHAPGASYCSCGGVLVEAAAPRVMRGVFRVEQRIGVGGMGVVYRALDLNLGRDVALKTLPSVTRPNIERLRHEARAMAAVVHPNLAVVHGVETWRGVPFLVEEYLIGGTMADRLAAGRLDIGQTLQIGLTLAGALEHMHRAGVLHCDVKPSNIGFTSGGEVKLLDFGLARLLHHEGTTTASASCPADSTAPGHSTVGGRGTPAYMSPEAVRGERPTEAFDVWGLVVVLFEALTGRRAFEGAGTASIFERVLSQDRPNLRHHRSDASEDLCALFDRALSLDAAVRPATAAVLFGALSSLRRMAG